ncbi:hypothetical protein [Novispirillum itersonii]|uniref:hypothetical protein n=1 Tax=Novispirillum itersonii TaxID=189 RepID=UPI000361C695|nr:hypothetical protein [Novispirillum itersonii]
MYYFKDGAFYLDGLNVIPDGAVLISAERHAELMNWQAAGKVIIADVDGMPTLADPVEVEETPEEKQAKVDNLRKLAYAAEADPLFFKWQRDEGTKEEWLSKVNEIRLRYPDIVM